MASYKPTSDSLEKREPSKASRDNASAGSSNLVFSWSDPLPLKA